MSLKSWMQKRFNMINPSTEDKRLAGVLSGTTVNQRTALTHPTVLACVRAISESISTLPWNVYQKTENGKRKAVDHAVYRILHERPNGFYTPSQYKKLIVCQQLLWNAHRSLIIRDPQTLEPIELYPIAPDKIVQKLIDGAVFYEVKIKDGKTEKVVTFGAEDIYDVPLLLTDGCSSIIDYMKNAIGGALAANEFANRYYSNNLTFGGTITHPNTLSDKAYGRLKSSLKEDHAGLVNAHKWKILEEGMEAKPFDIKAEDAQLLQSRQWNAGEIITAMRVPPHMAGDLSRSTNNNIEQQGIEFVTYTLAPYLVAMEEEANRKLFMEKGYYTKFNVDALLRGDLPTRMNAYSVGRIAGVWSQNEVRDKEDLDPIAGGNTYLVPLNMAYIDESGKIVNPNRPKTPSEATPAATPGVPNDQPTQSSSATPIASQNAADKEEQPKPSERGANQITAMRQLRKAFAPIVSDALQRINRKETKAIEAAIEKHLTKADRDGFSKWFDSFLAANESYLVEAFAPSVRSAAMVVADLAAKEANRADDVSTKLLDFIQAYAKGFSIRHTIDSREEIQAAMNEEIETEDLIKRIRKILNAWATDRINQEVQREMVQASNALLRQSYILLGAKGFEWRCLCEGSEICTQLNGRQVAANENFLNEGAVVELSESKKFNAIKNIGHAPVHRSCQCEIVPLF